MDGVVTTTTTLTPCIIYACEGVFVSVVAWYQGTFRHVHLYLLTFVCVLCASRATATPHIHTHTHTHTMFDDPHTQTHTLSHTVSLSLALSFHSPTHIHAAHRPPSLISRGTNAIKFRCLKAGREFAVLQHTHTHTHTHSLSLAPYCHSLMYMHTFLLPTPSPSPHSRSRPFPLACISFCRLASIRRVLVLVLGLMTSC